MTDPLYAPSAFDQRYARLRLVSPPAERSLRDSLERLGQLQPVIACRRGDALCLVDGFKRVRAGEAMGLGALRVRVLELSETAAIAAVMSLNRAGRGLSDLEQAMCVLDVNYTSPNVLPHLEMLPEGAPGISRDAPR